MIDPTRGVLYPARLPSFARLAPGPEVAALVRWFWIPEWEIAPGRSSRQEVIGYPAANVVVEPGGVSLVGPSTRRGHRDLVGRGWAVGALLRPAATAALIGEPSGLVDVERPVELPELHGPVAAAMSDDDAAAGPAERRTTAVAAFSAWLAREVPAPSPEALLANAMADLLLTDASVLQLADAAERLAVSPRTLQRLAHRYVGVSPAAMIRRRRLQEAAQRVREDPGADLAQIAAELGYADHAHLTRDFRRVLSFTPSGYRADT